MAEKKACRCGCWTDAVFECRGFEYDPKAPGGKGKAFVEYACHGSADYLSESSAELGLPFELTRLP